MTQTYTENFHRMVDLYVRSDIRVRPQQAGSSHVTWDLKIATVSQWILESGRGTSDLAAQINNFGGLKWINPADTRTDPYATRVHMVTPTEPQGEHWRAFATHSDWLNGYWQFIETGTTYEDPMKYATDPEGYIQMLKDGGYATDQDYVAKVVSVFPEAEALLYESAQRQGIDPDDSIDPPAGKESFRLAIVVGHNHAAPGACPKFDYPTECEWPWNSEIARRMEKRATNHGIKARVFFRTPGGSPSTEIRRCYDTEVNPWTRGHNALCLELHYNAGGGDGTEMLYWRGSTIGQPWARNLADVVGEMTGIATTRREDGIWGIRSGAGSVSLSAAEAPNCVVEPFFVDTLANCRTIQDAGGQSTLADAYLAAAVKTAEEHGWTVERPPPTEPPPVEPPPPGGPTIEDCLRGATVEQLAAELAGRPGIEASLTLSRKVASGDQTVKART